MPRKKTEIPTPEVKPAARRRVPGATTPKPSKGKSSNGRSSKQLALNGSSPTTHAPSYEEIAEAAYLRYVGRGGTDGSDFDDWLEAEQGLRKRE